MKETSRNCEPEPLADQSNTLHNATCLNLKLDKLIQIESDGEEAEGKVKGPQIPSATTPCTVEIFEDKDHPSAWSKQVSTPAQASVADNCLTFRTIEAADKKENGYLTQRDRDLQVIKDGKAYLERKIGEYEARLTQMKQHKDTSMRMS